MKKAWKIIIVTGLVILLGTRFIMDLQRESPVA